MTSKVLMANILLQAVQFTVLILILVFVVSIYYLQPRKETKYLIAKEGCGERATFLKILILSSDIELELAREIAKVVDEASRDFNKDSDFILAIIMVESRFNPKVVSYAGAHGLMQVMPLWLKVMGAEGEDLFDLRVNVRRGLQVYSSYEQMLKTPELALTAYNRGSWKVEEDLRNERDPRNGYAKKVLDVYDRLKLMQ